MDKTRDSLMLGYQLLGTIAVPLEPANTLTKRKTDVADLVYPHGYDYIVALTRLDDDLRKATNHSGLLMIYEIWKEVKENG